MIAAELLAFARDELDRQKVEAPSRGALLEQARLVVIAGPAVHAGLHTLRGIVRVRVVSGASLGLLEGESLLDARVEPDLEPSTLRTVVSGWLTADEGALVQVRLARPIDRLATWLRWQPWALRLRWLLWRRAARTR